MPLIVDVTQEDINEGKACVGSSCPISTAVKRKGVSRVRTDLQKIQYTTPEGKRLYYFTPTKAQQFLFNFDLGNPVKPFRFQLQKPYHVTVKKGKKKVEIKKFKNGAVQRTIKVNGRPPSTGPVAGKRLFGLCTLRVNQQVREDIKEELRKEMLAGKKKVK